MLEAQQRQQRHGGDPDHHSEGHRVRVVVRELRCDQLAEDGTYVESK